MKSLATPHTLHHQALATVTLTAPSTPSPKPTVTPTPTPTAAPVKPRTRRRVATAPQTLPAVAPVPESAVNHLVTVADPTPSPTASPTASPTPSQAPVTAAKITYTSTNWAGYMSPAGHFTAVSGSWKVPSPRGNGTTTTADTAWIGIGGVTSNDLIQVGTNDTVSRSGRVTITPFYELLPDAETAIPSMSVSVGDAMTADIHLVSGTQWQITLTDVTQNETFTIAVSYASSESTAEWIEEDPSYSSGGLVPFDTFGAVDFSASLATADGITQNLNSSGAQAIELVDSHGRALAIPSVIGSDGQSFTVTQQ